MASRRPKKSERKGRARERDPVLLSLRKAPIDDEPVTAEEEAAVAEARAEVERGELIADKEIWRRLGHAPRR